MKAEGDRARDMVKGERHFGRGGEHTAWTREEGASHATKRERISR